eukprot:scaffold8179_cov430-Prasinococcus_capsulatus_cf.AAC.5
MREFTAQHVGNMLWACGKMKLPLSPASCRASELRLVELLQEAAVAMLAGGQVKPQEMSNCIWGLATLGFVPSEQFVQAFSRECERQLPRGHFVPQTCSNILWSFAKLEITPRESLVRALVQETLYLVDSCTSQNVSNLLWAVAKAGMGVLPTQLVEVENAIQRTVSQAKPQDLANTVWAFATCGYQASLHTLNTICVYTERLLMDFNHQNISNMLWAFATLDYAPPDDLIQKLFEQLVAVHHTCVPQDISNSIWACANLNYRPRKTSLETMVRYATENMQAFKVQETVNLLWGIVYCKFAPHDHVMEAFVEFLSRNLDEYSCQSLSNNLWSFSMLNWDIGADIVDKCLAYFKRHIKEFLSQNYANTIWSLSTMGYSLKGILSDETSAHVKELLPTFTPQDMANSLWSFAVSDLLECNMAKSIWDAVQNTPAEQFTLQELCQIYQAVRVEVGAGDETEHPVMAAHTQLYAACIQAWSNEQHRHTVSQTQKSVFDTIKSMEYNVESERRLIGVVSIDIAIKLRDGKIIGLEVDGPTHFSVNTRRKSGSTVLRNTLIRKCGLDIVEVPFFEWDKLSMPDRRRYIEEKLSAFTGNPPDCLTEVNLDGLPSLGKRKLDSLGLDQGSAGRDAEIEREIERRLDSHRIRPQTTAKGCSGDGGPCEHDGGLDRSGAHLQLPPGRGSRGPRIATSKSYWQTSRVETYSPVTRGRGPYIEYNGSQSFGRLRDGHDLGAPDRLRSQLGEGPPYYGNRHYHHGENIQRGWHRTWHNDPRNYAADDRRREQSPPCFKNPRHWGRR